MGRDAYGYEPIAREEIKGLLLQAYLNEQMFMFPFLIPVYVRLLEQMKDGIIFIQGNEAEKTFNQVSLNTYNKKMETKIDEDDEAGPHFSDFESEAQMYAIKWPLQLLKWFAFHHGEVEALQAYGSPVAKDVYDEL